MIRKPVLSSQIRSVGYDPDQKRMEIEFHGGDVYSYYDVDPRTHHDLMNASSIGRHFHAHVKHKHNYSKH